MYSKRLWEKESERRNRRDWRLIKRDQKDKPKVLPLTSPKMLTFFGIVVKMKSISNVIVKTEFCLIGFHVKNDVQKKVRISGKCTVNFQFIQTSIQCHDYSIRHTIPSMNNCLWTMTTFWILSLCQFVNYTSDFIVSVCKLHFWFQ